MKDYDRIISQYGTVDALAMAGYYAQTAGKTVVRAVTVETLILSAEKVISSLWNTLHSSPSGVTVNGPRPGKLTEIPIQPSAESTRLAKLAEMGYKETTEGGEKVWVHSTPTSV